MIRLIILFFILFALNSCSFNQDSKFWTEQAKKKIIDDEKYIIKNENLMFNKLKEEIIKYGKNSDFPDISN